MPVPPLPPDNTVRWYLEYNDQFDNHITMARSSTTIDSVDASSLFDGFLTAFGDMIAEITIVQLSLSFEGSNVRIPQVWGGAPTYGTGVLPRIQRPTQYTLVGKDSLGHRSRIGLFGASGFLDETWRVFSTERTEVIDILSALVANAAFFLSISGGNPVWKPYMNVGVNDHWLKAARKG